MSKINELLAKLATSSPEKVAREQLDAEMATILSPCSLDEILSIYDPKTGDTLLHRLCEQACWDSLMALRGNKNLSDDHFDELMLSKNLQGKSALRILVTKDISVLNYVISPIPIFSATTSEMQDQDRKKQVNRKIRFLIELFKTGPNNLRCALDSMDDGTLMHFIYQYINEIHFTPEADEMVYQYCKSRELLDKQVPTQMKHVGDTDKASLEKSLTLMEVLYNQNYLNKLKNHIGKVLSKFPGGISYRLIKSYFLQLIKVHVDNLKREDNGKENASAYLQSIIIIWTRVLNLL